MDRRNFFKRAGTAAAAGIFAPSTLLDTEGTEIPTYEPDPLMAPPPAPGSAAAPPPPRRKRKIPGHQSAVVQYGVYAHYDPNIVEGKTVAELRMEFGGLWGIPADARAYVNNIETSDSYRMRRRDKVSFHRVGTYSPAN